MCWNFPVLYADLITTEVYMLISVNLSGCSSLKTTLSFLNPGGCGACCNSTHQWGVGSFSSNSCHRSDQIRSVSKSCPTICDPMNPSTPGLPVHHQLPEFTQTHVNRISDAIQPSHPLSSPSPPAPNPSQHQGLFQWINSSHEVAKVLEFQL